MVVYINCFWSLRLWSGSTSSSKISNWYWQQFLLLSVWHNAKNDELKFAFNDSYYETERLKPIKPWKAENETLKKKGINKTPLLPNKPHTSWQQNEWQPVICACVCMWICIWVFSCHFSLGFFFFFFTNCGLNCRKVFKQCNETVSF